MKYNKAVKMSKLEPLPHPPYQRWVLDVEKS